MKTPQEFHEPLEKCKSPRKSSFHIFCYQWLKAYLVRKVIHCIPLKYSNCLKHVLDDCIPWTFFDSNLKLIQSTSSCLDNISDLS